MDFGKIDFPTEKIVEGCTHLIVPKLEAFVKSPSEYAPSKAPVFYNPVMELNRDLAVLALQAYQKTLRRDLTICDPLASGGIRGVRFAKEIEGVESVVLNDISSRAVQLAKENIRMNKLTKIVTATNLDANLLMSTHAAPRKRFNAIDIDPFGSPVNYIDSAIRAIRDKGLIALTATDMAPLCGVHPKACIRKYSGKPLRTEYCHELAVRLLAGCLATIAAKHEIGIHVMFSHNADHYIRLYATATYGARNADSSLSNLGYALHCFNCFHRETAMGAFSTIPCLCKECHSKLSVSGPLWTGRLFDKQFCRVMTDELAHKTLGQKAKIDKMLRIAQDEIDAPLGYYVVDRLSDALNTPVPSLRKMIESLKAEGFQARQTVFNPKGIKTNAPASKVKSLLQIQAKKRQARSDSLQAEAKKR